MILVSTAQAATAATGPGQVVLSDDAAHALYDKLKIKPRIEQNEWIQDTYIKELPASNLICKMDMQQE